MNSRRDFRSLITVIEGSFSLTLRGTWCWISAVQTLPHTLHQSRKFSVRPERKVDLARAIKRQDLPIKPSEAIAASSMRPSRLRNNPVGLLKLQNSVKPRLNVCGGVETENDFLVLSQQSE